jgi:hypothetical protein
MTAIAKAIVRIATRVRNLEEDHGSECVDKKVAMTRVVEFYVPKNFRRPMKRLPELHRGKALAFCPQTKKSA